MKLFDNVVIREKYKYIEVVYTEITKSIAMMVKEHYDIKEYGDTVIFINIWANSGDELFSPEYFTSKRKIFYQLEHNNDFVYDKQYLDKLVNWINWFGITEMWDMEYDFSIFENRIKIPIKYMPVRYTSYFKKLEYTVTKDIDFGFVGRVDMFGAPNRNQKLLDLCGQDVRYKILYGKSISDFKKDLCNCKFVVDIPRNMSDENETQNQVRIFEHICLGHHVLTERLKVNIFPGLIDEWSTADELTQLINTLEPHDFSDQYKDMTYRDEDYENYKNNILKLYNETINSCSASL